MTKPLPLAGLLVAGLLMGGCATSGLGDFFGVGKSTTPQEARVPQGNALSLPPDLQLRQPGVTTDEYQPNAAAVSPDPAPLDADVAAVEPAPVAPAARPQPAPDVYAQYGILKTNPDGSKKSDAKMQEELRAAVIAKKRQQNPRYGTVFNIGNIFKDE
jgi:hypothetical protein